MATSVGRHLAVGLDRHCRLVWDRHLAGQSIAGSQFASARSAKRMRSNTRLTVMCLFAHAGLLLAADPPSTQPADEEWTDSPAPERFRLDFTDLYFGLDMVYQRRRVRTTIPRQRDTVHRNEDLRFFERAGLSLAGFVYDPGLLDYRANLEFGLTQGRFREQTNLWTRSESDSGFLTEYDINVDLFKVKPVSLNVYARRADVRIPRRFLPSLREERTETGASALAVGKDFTTEVGFSWWDIERFGNRMNEDDEELESARFYIDHRWKFSDTHKLRLLYDHQRDESTYQGSRFSFGTQRDEVRVEHELMFGPDNKHRMDTYLRYNAEKGDLARDVLELVPRLTLQHTEKFKTIHRYSLYQYDQSGYKVTQNRFDTDAIWQATDQLQLTLGGYGMHENVDRDIDIYQFGGLFDAQYHQPTSLGELSANLHLGLDHARTAGDAGRRFVRGEAHALGGSRPVFLRQRGVVPGSVVAYNAKRNVLFVPGVDYTVVVVAGRATVARTWTGRIAQNEIVYFDYAYVVPADGEVRSYRADLLIEHQFKFGLTPYYALETRCQETEYSVATPWYRDNQHRHRLGARFERERWNVGAEYEYFDDSILPYHAFHSNGRAVLLSGPAHNVDLNAMLSRYVFDDEYDDRRVWWLESSLTGRTRLLEYLWLKSSAAHHFENDSIDGNTHGVDLEAGLELKRGYLIVELVVEYDLLRLPRGDEQGVGVFLNVRRDLSHLLPARRIR